ncbi:hypothetical protein SLA2020_281090 [Shorea laevis]
MSLPHTCWFAGLAGRVEGFMRDSKMVQEGCNTWWVAGMLPKLQENSLEGFKWAGCMSKWKLAAGLSRSCLDCWMGLGSAHPLEAWLRSQLVKLA